MPAKEKLTHIKDYLHKIKSSSKELTKKEAFKDLLNRLYSDDEEIKKLIDKITLGAETTILNIPRKQKTHRGSADTLYNKIIIEFENDLKLTLEHAKEQLAGYLLGQFNSGEGYNFTLIVSDFINWKVFAPDIESLNKLSELTEEQLILNEIKSASFSLNEKNIEEFYYWIDRFLFREEKQKATLKAIEESFGYQSKVFIECYREMFNWFSQAKKFGEVQVSFEQWEKFLSIAYGQFEAKEEVFIIHSYLSVFAKMLAYSVLSNDDYIDDDELKSILDGTIFHKYNIRNFVENDFFHWVVSDRNFKNLKKIFRIIAQEISTFDFSNVDEDVLKGVYQELIDIDTRHSLGEYYTPDWLCERILEEFQLTATDRILDPACGSGSFLRAAIHRIKNLNPNASAEEINNHIFGIDIHPLSVQIAKTTLLLALGKEIINAKQPVYLNIILANTLLAPEGVQDLFGKEFLLNIDKEKFKLNTQILEDVNLFDDALEICDELAEQTQGSKNEDENTFENILRKKLKGHQLTQQIIDSFYKVYTALKSVKEKGRDSIWKFIVQNLYKPYFLAGKFDYLIGNPPWFTYSSIRNEDYQNMLNALAEKYEVKPDSIKNFPNLEIAAIFLSYCSSYFLKIYGKLAFVLPRSFFSADHHDNSRTGKARGFQLEALWDLSKVNPLFRVPSCVFFTIRVDKKNTSPSKIIRGKSFEGTLPNHNCNYSIVQERLIEKEETWYLRKQGKSSAFSSVKVKSQSKGNPYKSLFKRGAEITPRNFYFIELNQEVPPDWNDRILNIRTSSISKKDAKKPWNNVDIIGRIESRFIFRTAIAKSILPFALFNPDLIVLPVIIENKNNSFKKINILSVDELRKEGFLYASRWFQVAEKFWSIYKTEKNKNISAIEYLNWHSKLSNQNLNAEYLVIYNTSAKDANATVIRRSDLDLEFFVDTKAYVFFTADKSEAYYLAGILNSTIPNLLMKDFQSRGLFGARDVHKKILDIYFPRYDEANEAHKKLAELGEIAHQKAKEYLEKNPPQKELSATRLGRLRIEIKKHLSAEMKEIDKLVERVIE